MSNLFGSQELSLMSKKVLSANFYLSSPSISKYMYVCLSPFAFTYLDRQDTGRT
uniref:Uncharacterized protein n=1 Tax=Aegilops tauschii subsp. strangulata TaxID=200361 RepID=A0A453S1B5_AEGTS